MSLARGVGIFMFKEIPEWFYLCVAETETGYPGTEQCQREEAPQQVNKQPRGIVRGLSVAKELFIFPFTASQSTSSISLTFPVLLMDLSTTDLKMCNRAFYTS